MAHGRNENAATALAQSGQVVRNDATGIGCLTEEQVWQYVSGRIDPAGEAAIQRHMDGCRACCLVIADPIPFLTMEFLRGETLDRRIARQGRLHPAEVAALLPSIIAGLQAIHAAGVVHRDIKPQNIMVLPGPPERPVLTDFGVARRIFADPSRGNTVSTGAFVVGTVDYMAPE